jgi:hypothetical protein
MLNRRKTQLDADFANFPLKNCGQPNRRIPAAVHPDANTLEIGSGLSHHDNVRQAPHRACTGQELKKSVPDSAPVVRVTTRVRQI